MRCSVLSVHKIHGQRGAGYLYSRHKKHMGLAAASVAVAGMRRGMGRTLIAAVLLLGMGCANYTLELVAQPEDGGSVTVSPEPGRRGTYRKDTELTLSAMANEAYRFARWEGDLEGTDAETTLVMDSDKSATAVFLPLADDQDPDLTAAGLSRSLRNCIS